MADVITLTQQPEDRDVRTFPADIDVGWDFCGNPSAASGPSPGDLVEVVVAPPRKRIRLARGLVDAREDMWRDSIWRMSLNVMAVRQLLHSLSRRRSCIQR
jgi:hypothetical protein